MTVTKIDQDTEINMYIRNIGQTSRLLSDRERNRYKKYRATSQVKQRERERERGGKKDRDNVTRTKTD